VGRRGVVDMGMGVVVPMIVPMGMGVVMGMGVGRGGNHAQTLYYNITPVHVPVQGLPISMAMAAARNGNGTETAQRNQTNLAGMNGISHRITRWKANSAQATT
jgi:hypothetical protein